MSEAEIKIAKAKKQAAALELATKVLREVGYWFIPSHGRGQAEGTLPCGHCGPSGAPACRGCAVRNLKAILVQLK